MPLLNTSLIAYLDPGASSYVLQILAAFLVGALFAVKAAWSKIKSFFAGLAVWRKKT